MEEQIKKFLSVSYGYGDGSGDGYGYGDGSGDGYGSGSGDGDGSGYGYGYGYGDGSGDGDGSGYGYGYGYGDGSGSGDGYGYGSGDGSGDGYGSGYGIKMFDGDKVYIIDNVPTIINSIRNNVAKGFILNKDFTLEETFIVKENNNFAHGKTLHEAFQSLQEKLYDDSTEEERIRAFEEHFKDFTAKYPAKELFSWHHVLTGSCKQGRESFCRQNGIDLDKDVFTIYEFINLTKDSYGGEVIKKLVQTKIL